MIVGFFEQRSGRKQGVEASHDVWRLAFLVAGLGKIVYEDLWDLVSSLRA